MASKLTKEQKKQKMLIDELTSYPKSIFNDPKNSNETKRAAFNMYLHVVNVFTGTNSSIDKNGFVINPTPEMLQALGPKPQIKF